MASLFRTVRRLPIRFEIELAKFLGTIGFSDYASALWNLAHAPKKQTLSPPSPADPILSASILAQISEQSRHDPAVHAPGSKTIAGLSTKVRSPELVGLDTVALFDRLPTRADVVGIVASLEQADARYLADLVEAANRLGATSIVVIVTEQSAALHDPDRAQSMQGASTDATVVFWSDHTAGEAVESPRSLAIYIHAMGPAAIVVGAGDLGYKVVQGYGRALKRYHRLYCLFVFDADEPRPPMLVRYLRSVSAYATIVTSSAAAAERLDLHGIDPEGPGTRVLPTRETCGSDAFRTVVKDILGADFADQRSAASRSVITKLRSRGKEAHRLPAALAMPSQPQLSDSEIDITVNIIFHRERRLVVPALASLADMVQAAREAGLKIEVRALLDRADEPTRSLVAKHGRDFVQMEEVDLGDLGLVRNAAASRATGKFCAFFDGDDLWGAKWLLLAYRAATDEGAPFPAIWHPEALYVFYEKDFDVHSATETVHPQVSSAHRIHRASTDMHFDARGLLLESLWSANVFAPTDVYRRIPYRANDWERQAGSEDWRWNLETIGADLPHLVVPDTVHLIRVKDTGSLSMQQDMVGALPILT